MVKYQKVGEPVNNYFVEMFRQTRNELKINDKCPVAIISDVFEYRQPRKIAFKIKFKNEAFVFDYTLIQPNDLSGLLSQIVSMKRDFKIDYWNIFGPKIKKWQKQSMIKKVAGRLGL